MERLNKLILVLIVIVGCYTCHRNRNAQILILDYSYDSGWAHSYSMKVYGNNKAYLRKTTRKSDTLYTNDNLNAVALAQIILRLHKAKLRGRYEDSNIQDASSFNAIVYFDKHNAVKYHVYGNKCPEPLRALQRYAEESLKDKGWHVLTDTSVTFSSLTGFQSSSLDSNIRFLPPDVKK